MKLNCANRKKRSSDEGEHKNKNKIIFSWEYTLKLCSILSAHTKRNGENAFDYAAAITLHYLLYTTVLR